MNETPTIGALVGGIFRGLLDYVTDFVPRFLTAIVIILVGWVIAKIIQRVFRALLSRIRFDTMLEKAGVVGSLRRIGLQDPPSSWLPRVAFWLLMVLFVRTAAQVIGLHEISDAISVFFSYLPRVTAALLIVLFGNSVGQFLGRAVTVAAEDSGIDYAPVLGRLVSVLIFFVVIILAIGQLRIDMAFVNSIVLIVFGGFALSFALSFGLGTREITRNIIAGIYARKAFRVGQEVEIHGRRGVIKGFTPIMTLLESNGVTTAVSNGIFLQDAIKS
ncbi:MAG: hypothetical protein ABIK65_09605 [Candidatus Eisenbacteria bacterium]